MSAPAYIHVNDPASDATAIPTPNFDPLARLYRWMEWLSFGPFLSRCRRVFLPRVKDARRALVLGDGDGRFTAALLRSNRQVRLDALDISPAMLTVLRQRAGRGADRLRTEVRDVRQWTPDSRSAYDLVATHFFLDCLSTSEIFCLAQRLRPHLAPGAQWVISEFSIPRNWFGQLVARPLIAFLYWAFRVMTGLKIRRLPEHHLALTQSGFTLAEQRRLLNGLLVSEIWLPTSATDAT